jgi:predicted nucleic acid-binding protein
MVVVAGVSPDHHLRTSAQKATSDGWLRGPRHPEELRVQGALFPDGEAVPFGSAEAALASELYRLVRRPRGRELDLAIAASSILQDAALWTLNPRDFTDIPGLRLLDPPRR